MNVFTIYPAPCAFLRAAGRRVAATARMPPKADSSVGVRCLSGGVYPRPTAHAPPRSWQTPRLCAYTRPLGVFHGRRSLFSSSKVIRNYEDLPRDYRDQAGLQFGARELSEEEIGRIFGAGLTAAAGNRLLRILHGRRVAGTLDDPAFAAHTAQFPEALIARGLEYLRQEVPVNEVMNAGLRAEDELNQMDRDVEERESQERAASASGDRIEGEGEDAGPEADPVYGRGAFDRIRARNIAKQKAKDKIAEEERLAREAEEQVGVSGPLARREDGSRAITNPKVAEYYEKAQSGLEAPPEMKTWERVLPSATVVALVLGFMAAVATVYEEPMPRYRLLRDVSTAHATVGTLIALNALVFLGWRVPPLWSLFNKYMIFVVATVRPPTLFTAVFSHTRLSHMLVNMVPLWFIGTALHEELGRADFLTLYLGCGAAGFLGSLVTYTLRGWLTVTSLGASGATLGLCSAYFWEHRTDGFKVLGLPRDGVHGIVFLALMAALQLAAFGRTRTLRVDIASHLSGMAAGILGIEMLSRTARGRRTRRTRASSKGAHAEKEVINVWGADGRGGGGVMKTVGGSGR
ncbi:rhomboid family protein [Metarhizium acridum CQMa 102]|uniref:Rhomboid family protein n=1 Tax=Metarhizium acridum (strain CQMa 102) TaxID=655827 RepID=E9E1M0_METAQ|nr:rhomboid family protein [Metarhizium acridum CQMa 102]EFY90253.1 rhomboid family protein [Metarhizium acridum CQMa 102]